MTPTRFFRCSVFCGLALILAACTNTREDQSILSYGRALQESLDGGSRAPMPDRQIIDAAIAQALAATDRPLALITLENTGMVALITPIESNGPYRTWATFGSSERRSLTSRSGVVTATRGLGGDLMSSNVSDLLRILGKTGDGASARQILRHLNGENVIVETSVDCTITTRVEKPYRMGELNETSTRLNMVCENPTERFENSFVVTRGGRIVEARQWLGPVLGMSTFQQVR